MHVTPSQNFKRIVAQHEAKIAAVRRAEEFLMSPRELRRHAARLQAKADQLRARRERNAQLRQS